MSVCASIFCWSVAVGAPELPRFGLPSPGIAATGSFNCAGRMVVNPSLTRMIDLRPSRSPPIRTAAPFSASIVTWLRTRSTTEAG